MIHVTDTIALDDREIKERVVRATGARGIETRRQAAKETQRTVVNEQGKMVYWHRELPPLNAEAVGEHTLEAISGRVPDTIAHREELWSQCKDDLKAHTHARLLDEIARLGGRYAHVLDEAIDTKHDAVTGEAWLHGRFTYMLYR